MTGAVSFVVNIFTEASASVASMVVITALHFQGFIYRGGGGGGGGGGGEASPPNTPASPPQNFSLIVNLKIITWFFTVNY